MTEDPYRLDDDLQLSSIDDSDFDDEYDGLETDPDQGSQRGIRKMPIVLGMMLVVFVSGAAYIAYQMFVVDVGPIVPAQSPMVIAQQQAQPPFSVDDTMPPELPPMLQQDGVPPQDFMPPMDTALMDSSMPPALGDASMQEMDPDAVMAEGLLPPPVDSENADEAAIDAFMDLPPMDGMAESAVEYAPVTAEANEQVVFNEPEIAYQEDAAFTPDQSPSVENTLDEVADITAELDVMETTEEVAQAPSEDLLQPIDPVPASAQAQAASTPSSLAEAATKAVEDTVPAVRQARQVANRKVDEVQKILESAGIENAPAQPVQPAVPAAPVEVTPRAREVIVVTRTYGAQSPQAAIAAGERVLQAQQYDAAADIFDNQLRQNPSDPLALAGKALALQKAGNDVEAMNTYERLITLNPRDVEAMTNYLGLLQNQDPQQALIRLQNLGQQYPDNAAIAGQLGMLSARMMDTPNAIRQFQTAAALDRTNATYPFNLAVLYDRLGSKTKAVEQYRRALVLARDYPSRAQISLDVIRQRLHALR